MRAVGHETRICEQISPYCRAMGSASPGAGARPELLFSARLEFGSTLALVVGVAFVLRVVYGLAVAGKVPLVGDGVEFDGLARLIADGHGYVNAFAFYFQHKSIPVAIHPPLYPLFLALLDALGGASYVWHQIGGALLGAGTVAGVGLLGRQVAGNEVGLTAATIAALYPVLVVSDTSLRVEALYALLIVSALLGAYRLRDRPTWSRAAQLGAIVGLAALTRSEAIVLLVLLALPAVWRVGRRRGLALFGVTALTAALVVSPWFIRCWLAFGRPVVLSTTSGTLLAGANCQTTYYGALIGWWSFNCSTRATGGDELVAAARLRQAGISYARHHTGRLPLVISARVGRTWNLYRPKQDVTFEAVFDGHNKAAGYAGIAVYYVLLVLAVIGAMCLRRQRKPLWILLLPFVFVTLISIAGYGESRFRIPADISITVLAAVGVHAVLSRGRERRLRTPRPLGG